MNCTNSRTATPPDALALLHQGLHWQVPEHFNIAEVCCTRWARQAASARQVAIAWEHEDGRRGTLTFAALKHQADRLSHASLLEAASLSPAQLRRFTHNDPQQLAQLLAKPLAGEQLAVTEGIFSMDGDSAPLAAIHAATQAAGAVLLVDDAHGVGVVGDEGRGSCAAQAVRPELLVVTFGKAFGVSGAAVLCDEAMADYLLQFARHLIYSTAMPPAQAVALSAALGIIRSDEGQQRRDILAARIRQFREGMGEVSLGLTDSVSAIQPLIVGDNARALNLACRLRDAGCWATAIRPPTVPVGSARLRLTLTAAHHTEDINRLLEVLHGHSE